MVTLSCWKTLQQWEGRQDKGSAPQLPAPADFVHAAVSASFLPAPVIQTKQWGWQPDTAQLCQRPSLCPCHLDTLIPLVWDNHCPNGAFFSREKGSATEWGSCKVKASPPYSWAVSLEPLCSRGGQRIIQWTKGKTRQGQRRVHFRGPSAKPSAQKYKTGGKNPGF